MTNNTPRKIAYPPIGCIKTESILEVASVARDLSIRIDPSSTLRTN